MAKPIDVKKPSLESARTGLTAEAQSLEETDPTDDRDLVLSHREAEAGCPPDGTACGEEDPGSGLELLVTREIDQ